LIFCFRDSTSAVCIMVYPPYHRDVSSIVPIISKNESGAPAHGPAREVENKLLFFIDKPGERVGSRVSLWRSTSK
jgi:hypothetical protein